jgi:hypothetical protein
MWKKFFCSMPTFIARIHYRIRHFWPTRSQRLRAKAKALRPPWWKLPPPVGRLSAHEAAAVRDVMQRAGQAVMKSTMTSARAAAAAGADSSIETATVPSSSSSYDLSDSWMNVTLPVARSALLYSILSPLSSVPSPSSSSSSSDGLHSIDPSADAAAASAAVALARCALFDEALHARAFHVSTGTEQLRYCSHMTMLLSSDHIMSHMTISFLI